MSVCTYIFFFDSACVYLHTMHNSSKIYSVPNEGLCAMHVRNMETGELIYTHICTVQNEGLYGMHVRNRETGELTPVTHVVVLKVSL